MQIKPLINKNHFYSLGLNMVNADIKHFCSIPEITSEYKIWLSYICFHTTVTKEISWHIAMAKYIYQEEITFLDCKTKKNWKMKKVPIEIWNVLEKDRKSNVTNKASTDDVWRRTGKESDT